MLSTTKVPKYTIHTHYTTTMRMYVDRHMDCGFPTHSPESSFIGQALLGFQREEWEQLSGETVPQQNGLTDECSRYQEGPAIW